jgi:hypothetical protein
MMGLRHDSKRLDAQQLYGRKVARREISLERGSQYVGEVDPPGRRLWITCWTQQAGTPIHFAILTVNQL